ncbi:hypothetical protein FH972_025602 [Carpinus fangiana]|uniref:Major facilitator superfamily (MFS) profile domain-containing protein n=1 Tax=Carpinus fangiana TaxID=176857 RepID=A0A5N6L1W2_9ROSI|nr:hypothetical protein FH972_025602 [Carpinus fangiana]
MTARNMNWRKQFLEYPMPSRLREQSISLSPWTMLMASSTQHVGMLVGWGSSIDSGALTQASEAFKVSDVTETFAGTGIFLIAFGFGSLLSGPFSETVGRNPVYIVSLALFMIFTMASGLAPNIGAQCVFRFFAGFFGCTPLTTFGGSVSDMWNQLEKTYVFPVCACLSFLGPFLAPLVGAYIGQSTLVSWRWVEWTTLIFAALVTGAIALFVPETYPPVLAGWKAAHLRRITDDARYRSEEEVNQKSFRDRLLISIYRPFRMFFCEIMVLLFTLYMSVVYIVLFTFLTGYTFIYGDIYGFSQGQVGLCFIGMNVGFLIALAACYPIYLSFKRQVDLAGGKPLPAEERLCYWSCLVASVAFGFSVQGIFISSYQYLIDSFEGFAASALVAMTFMRYVAAGGMVVVSTPMYKNLGVHWTLTILGCISLLMVPIPYAFYFLGGKKERKESNSKEAVSCGKGDLPAPAPQLSAVPTWPDHSYIHAKTCQDCAVSSGRKVVGPALLARPGLVVCASVLLEDLLVIAVELLAAELADALLLGFLDGRTVGVDGHARASGLGFFVLAVDTIFLGDGHDGRVTGFVKMEGVDRYGQKLA